MALPEEFLLELKSRNDIESVVSSYVAIKKGGRNPKGLCPFHNEKTPSFTLYPDNNSFYCFGCGAGGDVVRFISMIENLDYIEAVRFLADRSGMSMPQDGYDDTALQQKRTVLAINRETARFFYSVLKTPAGKVGYTYFKNRGLTDATITHFGLGYAPDEWNALRDHLKAKGYSYEQMAVAGVVTKGKNGSYYDRFRGRAMFPILDIRGNVIAFGGRRMKDDDSAKYINTADTPVFKKSHNVYAMNFAKGHCEQQLILCEGYMDVIALHQAGFENAVAPLGTAFTTEQAQLLSRYTGQVVLTLDADAAGQKATDRALGILQQAGVAARVIRIPDGKDPDEFMKNNGADGPARFKALLEGAVNDTEYRLFQAAQGQDLSTDSGRVAYLKNAAKVIGEIASPVEADVYAHRIAKQCGVSKDSVLQAAKDHRRRYYRQKQEKELKKITVPVRQDAVTPERIGHNRAVNAEEGLLAVYFKNPDFLLKPELQPNDEDFSSAFHRRVYAELYRRAANHMPFDLTAMGEQFTGEELGRLVRIQALGENRANTADECLTCLRVMREEKVKESLRTASDDSDEAFVHKMRQLAENKHKGVSES